MSSLSYLEATVVGLFQGVTELFPVSSLGHSILVPALVGGRWARDLNVSAPESPYLAFIVGLHVATAAALLLFFWRDWVQIVTGFYTSVRYRRIQTTGERPRVAPGRRYDSSRAGGSGSRAHVPHHTGQADTGSCLPGGQWRPPVRGRATPPPDGRRDRRSGSQRQPDDGGHRGERRGRHRQALPRCSHLDPRQRVRGHRRPARADDPRPGCAHRGGADPRPASRHQPLGRHDERRTAARTHPTKRRRGSRSCWQHR